MRTVTLLMLALILLPIAHAADIGLDNFDGAAGASPPMLKTAIEDQVGEEDIARVRLIDLETGQRISYAHVQYRYKDTESILFIENESLSIPIDEARSYVTLKVDLINTVGNDYYRNLEVRQGSSVDALLLPIGSLQGRVLQDGRIITDASVQIECGGNYGEEGEVRTDQYGSYSSPWLPTGSCQVHARAGRSVGYAQVEIVQGEIAHLDIELDHKENSISIWWYVFGAMIIIIIILVIGIIASKRSPGYSKPPSEPVSVRGEEVESEEKRAEKKKKRQEDLLKTLNAKEVKIMNYLLETGAKGATQGQIKNETIIPKTTLSRLLSSLEAKKLIGIEKIGNMKRIRPTPFFLGEEDEKDQ